MESRPHNPELGMNPENFHHCSFSCLFQLSGYAIGSNGAFYFFP